MMWALKILRRIVGVKNQAAIIYETLFFRGLKLPVKTRATKVRYGASTCLPKILNKTRIIAAAYNSKAAVLRVILASPFPHLNGKAPVFAMFGFRRVA